MPNRIKLALLYGGKSSEHEISLLSAASVVKGLDPDRYHVTPVGIDREGRYFINDYDLLRNCTGPLPVVTETSKPLESLILQGRFAFATDVVFPVVHGPLYEDGCFQGLLELAGVAYVGSGVLSSAMGMDKDIQRRVACVDEVQCTRYRKFSWLRERDNLEDYCRQTVTELGWPLFVKPCSMGSSVGIHKVNSMDTLMNAISDARRYDDDILIEAFVEGREIELAVLEGPTPQSLPRVSLPGEICVKHPDGFYSYTAKYLESEQTELYIPARLDESVIHRLQQMAADIFLRLKCRGMARVDFFVKDNQDIFFSEVNTLPGFTPISMYPKLWKESGLGYTDLLNNLVNLAIAHRQHKDQLVTQFQ